MLKKRLNLGICTLDILNKFCLQNLYAKPLLKKVKLTFFSINSEIILQNKINLMVSFFLLFFKEVSLKLRKNTISTHTEKNTAALDLFYEIVLTKKQQFQLFLELFFFQISFGDVDYKIKKYIKNSINTLKIIDISLESFFEFNAFSKFLDSKNIKLEVSLSFIMNTNIKTDKISNKYLSFWLL